MHAQLGSGYKLCPLAAVQSIPAAQYPQAQPDLRCQTPNRGMANVFKGAFTALFVETPDYQVMSEEDVKRLRNNMHLAEQLGAKIETVYGEDVSYQIAEFARLSGVSKL